MKAERARFIRAERTPATKRAGSPWTGLWAVTLKELADHLSSPRMFVLEVLILLTALGTVLAAIATLREVVAEDPFLFLRIFTVTRSGEAEYSFLFFISFLIPLVAIALGFDAVNSEHNRRTLSRILSQPIYRDALLAGKFLAGLLTLTITLLALWLLVTGLGIFRLGVVPSGEEVARSLLFLVATVAYAGIWLVLAMLFSVQYRQPATSALAALAVWLFFAIFWRYLLNTLVPLDILSTLERIQFRLFLDRLSPNTLYAEVISTFLNPETRALGPVLAIQLEGAIRSPLPLSQSILLSWPQLTGMVAGVLLLFAGTYVLFQRQEIRA